MTSRAAEHAAYQCEAGGTLSSAAAIIISPFHMLGCHHLSSRFEDLPIMRVAIECCRELYDLCLVAGCRGDRRMRGL